MVNDELPPPPKARRLWLGLLVVLLGVTVAGYFVAGAVLTDQPPLEVQAYHELLPTVTPGAAPEFSLPTLDGEELSLEQWRGKGIVLNFWATWCYPCREEMPLLATFHQAHEENIVVIGVNYEESAEQARSFVEEMGIPFPILLDRNGELADRLQVRGLPTTFFIDAEGRIVGSHLGPLSEQQLAEKAQQLR